MKTPIAIFYHTRISGGLHTQINPDTALAIAGEQMAALRDSGLADEASKIVVGNNGSEADSMELAELMVGKSDLVAHGPDKHGELPTLCLLRQFCRDNPGWAVLYFHAKGASYPPNDLWGYTWRGCMMSACVWNWRQSVLHLGAVESVGAHWLTREKYGPQVNNPFWGGNFWWARSEFLSTLQELPPTSKTREEMFLAESWIGSGRRPSVFDYHDQWPNMAGCSIRCK